MIVTGEASGDLHGGALAEALFHENKEIEIIGFGGEVMRSAGVDVKFDVNQLGIVGLFEVLYRLKSVLSAYRFAVKLLQGLDLLVLIDFPDFNLRLARVAKQHGVPVVYYVSPQVWAWRSGRLKTIAERVDQMLVILPFEEEIYRKANVPCDFVGHPLLDELTRLGVKLNEMPEERRVMGQAYLKENGLVPDGITIGLLPGSREREVRSLLPDMLEGMKRLSKEIRELQILIPVAPTLPKELIAELCESSPLPITVVEGEIYEVFRASDVAVVASGTATLQGTLAGTPMVIVYKVSWLTYWLGRWLIHVKAIGLANIIAPEPFIPELIQGDTTPERICEEVRRFLKDDAARKAMKQGLKDVVDRLGGPGASTRAASIILKILKKSRIERSSQEILIGSK